MHAVLIFWIGLCAWLNCMGWLLSALHQLNRTGYAVALLPVFVAAILWFKKNPPSFNFGKLCRRFWHPMSAAFLLMTLMAFLGGILHAPNNFDAVTYRFTRILQWLSHGQWFWISTANERLNYSNTGWEWLGTPLMCLTSSDRLLFLINALGFLFMPGMLFSVFRKLGVSHRTAWWWMWIVPAGYGYALQAASVGNDLTGTLFFLAALYFGLRSRKSRSVCDVFFAILATALMSGVKLSNLPLGLPCLLAMLPALPLLRKHLLAAVLVLVVAVMSSALPIMALNQLYTGSWNGDPLNKYQMQAKDPVGALLGNGLLVAEQSLQLPVLPHAGELRQKVVNHLPEPVTKLLHKSFPRYYIAGTSEFPGEEGAGLGLGITLALIISALAAVIGFRKCSVSLVICGGWFAAIFFMAKLGSEAGPRLMLPFYPVLIAGFLVFPAQRILMRSKLWRAYLVLIPLFVLPVILLSPSRPVLPPAWVQSQMANFFPGSPILQRIHDVYSTYSHRNDLLAELRPSIPSEVRELGVLEGGDDTDYSLWRPYGSRRMVYLNADTKAFLQNHGGVEWAVIKEIAWKGLGAGSFDEWLAQQGGEIVKSVSVVEIVSWGPENWYLVRFKNVKRG